jgi:hypothetical protein
MANQNLLPSKVAKQRIGRLARAADKDLCTRLLAAVSNSPAPGQAEEAWCSAFRDWAITILDGVLREYLEQPQNDIEDLEAAVIDGPGRWLIGRAYSPDGLLPMVLKVLADAGRPLRVGELPEKFIPYTTLQDAIRERARHWDRRAADYEEPEDLALHDTAKEHKNAAPLPATAPWPWANLTIRFVGANDVVVKSPSYTGPRTFRELGFSNKKSGKPVRSWGLLFALAAGNGEVTELAMGARSWDKVEKAAQDLRQRLKSAFRHPDDPLLTITHGKGKGGCRALFTILLDKGLEPPPSSDPRRRSLGHGPDR